MQQANYSVDWNSLNSFASDDSTYDALSESPDPVPGLAAVSCKAEELSLDNASSGTSSMPALSAGKAIVPQPRFLKRLCFNLTLAMPVQRKWNARILCVAVFYLVKYHSKNKVFPRHISLNAATAENCMSKRTHDNILYMLE